MKRFISLLMVICLVLSFVPVQAAALDQDETSVTEEDSGIVYSGQALILDQDSTALSEEEGNRTITITRIQGVDAAATYTLAVYDTSANYGLDYQLVYDGAVVEKIEGSASIYDVFRDQGQLTSGQMLDLTNMANQLESIESGEETQSISAADMMAQLDDLGVKAAVVPVTFEAGEDSISLTIEVIDDLEPEYTESFMMSILDEDGQLVETAQAIFTIEDNDSPAPSYEVAFNCDSTLELDAESGEAELVFQRTGNLATNSRNALCVDGEPLGWVDFAPWQDTQTVWVIQAGTYTLADSDGYFIEGQQVEVEDNRPTETAEVEDGADPELDALPEEYAVIRGNRQSIDTSWLPSWARGSSYSDEYSVVIMGSTSNSLFKAGGNSSKGEVDFFVDDKNIHNVSTSGTGSYTSTGELWADSKSTYDWTGVESVESTVYSSGVDHEADIGIGVHQTVSGNLNVTNDGKYTIKATLPDKFQGTKYVYYHNVDPKSWCGGTEMYVPNGFKMNLRQYRFVISDDSTLVKGLTYTGGSDPGTYVPSIVGSKSEQYMTINSKTYGKNKTIDIVYTTDTQYPAQLVGYKIRNMKDGTTSDTIPLTSSKSSESNNTVTKTASFTFDADFLKKYESKYCEKIKNNQGTECWTFQIIPVYEKVKATQIDILETREGNMVMRFDPYIGDKVRFSDYTSDVVLAGVWYEAKKGISDNIATTGITYDRVETSTGKPDYDFSILYPVYRFKGVYNNDAARLAVYYADDEAASLGKLAKEGEIISADQYITGDYVALMATPNSSSYVTRWDVNGTYYYGNVYYHQLNGNPDDNIVKVEFVKNPNDVPTALVGVLTIADTDLRTGIVNYCPMSNVKITITADKTYTATTDSKGNFTISQFNGVSGATYSVAVDYGTVTGYNTFEYGVIPNTNTSHAVFIQMSQLPAGVPYPDTILANVNGTGYNQNMLELLTDGTMTASVRVYCPPKNFEITGVNFYFLEEGMTISSSNGTAFEAKYESTDGNFQTWTLTAPTSQIKSGSQLYVEVISKRTIYDDKGTTTTEIKTGLVNCGYGFTKPDEEKVYYVSYDIPATPSMDAIKSISLKNIWLPCLGNLDFSVSSRSGGFFSQRNDANGNLILTCGCEYLSGFGTGSVTDKYKIKQQTKEAVEEKKKSKALEDQPVGGSDTEVTAITPGEEPAEGATGDPANAKKDKKPSNWSFSPAFLFRIVVSRGVADPDTKYIAQYEMSLGFDLSYARNIPINVGGCPFYAFINFNVEAYFDLQMTFEKDAFTLDNFVDAWYEMLETNTGIEEINTFIAAPIMKIGITGGMGYNGFASIYLRGSVDVPFIFSIYPVDGAAQVVFSLGGGVNVILFDLAVDYSIDTPAIGNEDLMRDLKTVKELSAKTTVASTQAAESSSSGLVLNSLDDLQELDLNELLNEGTFKVMEHSGKLRRSSREAGEVATDVFKETGIHLHQLDDGTLLAYYLQDTAKDGEDTLNWLTVAYSTSTDGGETWSQPKYVCDNTGNPNTSLQYDINVFELEDRTLVTWSEADFDEVLKNLDDVDITKLTPAQIAKFMNAMNLRGRFFDSKGEPMGESFTIAENSTVACGALDAVQNGNNVYVYYQRNIFPYDETDGEVTVTQLLSTERTIALARCNVAVDATKWTSTSVRATNDRDQEFRITDVEPFVHDGIMGEILVLDRDGKLAEWDEYYGTWENSTEDRQLYLRTYTFDTDGTPIPSALMAITDTDDCAQSPQVVSNDDYLHLFWNQNGKVVYITDFVATYKDNEDVQAGAYVVKNSDGSMTTKNLKEYEANDIASDDSFHVGTTFSAAMDEAGNVLLSWVATDTSSDELLPTDEVYGVVLNTVTNAQAVETSETELEGNANVYQLSAQGAPVALTDAKALINSLDSLFLDNEGSFLLAYSQFNSTDITKITGADIKTAKSDYTSDLEITEVYANEYPMPGSTMMVDVTVTNNGLGTAKNVALTATGVGEGASSAIDSLLPGTSTTVTLEVAVPKDFNKSTTLNITAADTDSTATTAVDVLYGPHFEVYEMPTMTNIRRTSDYLTETLVYNAGNAPGKPSLDYTVTLFARNDDAVKYSYTADEVVEPGHSLKVSYLLEGTPVANGTTGVLSVCTSENADQYGADQYIQNYMPQLTEYLDVSGISGSEPDEPDTPVKPVTPVKPSKPGTSGGGSTTESEKEEPVETPVEKPSVSFTDVPTNAYYYEAVQWAVENAITTGATATTFDPEGYCTRAQAVTFLWRAAGCPQPQSSAMPFGDVPANAYYYDAVLWAVENGITTGLTATTFGPNETCTRAQIVTFIYRYEQAQGGGFTGAWMFQLPFTDTPQWAYEAIAWCYMNNITTGTTATTFGPDDNCTRAQIVTFLWRYSKGKEA